MAGHSKVNDTNTNPQQEEHVKSYNESYNESSDISLTDEPSRVEKMQARIDRLQKLRKRSVIF
jgi:hypothetical protein